jgi:hypothetical protein
MATDPSQLIAMLVSNSGLAGQYFLSGQDQARKQQQDDQATAMNSLKLQSLQQQVASDSGFQADWSAYLKNPTNDRLAQIAVKYPSHAEAVKQFWAIKDPDARRSHINAIAEPLAALQNNKTDMAIERLQRLRDATSRAGDPTDDLDSEIAALQSGDQDSVNAVKATLMMHLAAADTDGKFAESVARAQKAFNGGDPYTLAPGDVRYDGNNQVVARGDPRRVEPFHYSLKDASGQDHEYLYDPGADTSGSNTAASPLPSGSLAIRLNNPGAIRFDPKNQWQGQIGEQNGFAQFDTPENGARAHRLLIANQIKSGFDTPLAWANHYAPASDGNDPAAYAATIARGLGIGVNDKIPVSAVPKMAAISARVEGGGTPAPSSQPQSLAGSRQIDPNPVNSSVGADVPGDPNKQGEAYLATLPGGIRGTVKAIANGQMAAPSSFALTKPYWQQVMGAVTQYDPTFDSSTQPQRVAAAKAFTGNGKAAQAVASIDRLSYHLNDLYRDSQALTGWNLGPASGLFNAGVQTFQKAAVARYTAALPFVAGELQKLTKNGSATEAEGRQIMANLAPTQPASARLAAMQQLAELAQGQFKPIRDQWTSAYPDGRPMPMDVSPEANAILDSLNGDKGPVAIDPHTGKLAKRGAGFAPAVPAPPAPAIALLRRQPALAPQFDQKYGLGAAARILDR